MVTMSYINEALKKAQRERDSRYGRFGGIIASGPIGTGKSVKQKIAIGSAIALIVLIPTGLLMAFYFLQQPSAGIKAAPLTVISQMDETKSAMVPVEKGPVVIPKATTGGSAQAENAAVSSDGLPSRREAEVRYREALTAHRSGDYKRAEDLYQQALMLDPGHVRTLNNLGVLFMDQKKKGQAVALFNRAIILKRDYVDPYYNLACLYARTEEIDESIRYLNMAMAINRDVKNWVEKDADMKSVVTSDAFKKIMEGQKN
jgi:tetratricopeptide (TPR) repeat protein